MISLQCECIFGYFVVAYMLKQLCYEWYFNVHIFKKAEDQKFNLLQDCVHTLTAPGKQPVVLTPVQAAGSSFYILHPHISFQELFNRL